MTEKRIRHFDSYRGFSLGEMLAALVIGAMVLTAILGIYGRANQAAQAVRKKIEAPAMATETLQLIAQDLDRIMETSDVEVQVKNGFDNGYPSAELTLRRTYKDSKNEKQTFEEIVWRSAYDYDSPEPGLVLYRSYTGIGLEDKLLDSKRDDWEINYPYIPVCAGLTVFEIEVPKGDGVVRVWPSGDAPTAVKVTVSFGETYEGANGALDVSEADKVTRTMAIDKTRAIKFTLAAEGGMGGQEGQEGQSEEEVQDKGASEAEPEESTGARNSRTGSSTNSRSRSGNERTSGTIRR